MRTIEEFAMFQNGYAIPPHLAECDEDDFLGQHRLVSEVFSIDGDSEEYEHLHDWDDFTPAIWSDGSCEIVGLVDFEPCTVALRHQGETVGFYMGGQCWIGLGFRGKGYGPALVLSAIALAGEFPDVQDIGFTEAGYRTHLSALRQLWEMHQFPAVNP